MLSFSIGKTKLKVSFSFTVCIALLAILDKTGLLFVSFVAVFMHEIGHYIALKLCGINRLEISFILASVKISTEEQMSNKTSVIISVAGPIANLILSIFVLINNYYVKYFGVANFILFIFNSLPVANLDGGDLLKYLLCCIFKSKGELVFRFVSVIVLILFLAPLGVFFMLKFKNPTIFLVNIYLIIMSYRKV